MGKLIKIALVGAGIYGAFELGGIIGKAVVLTHWRLTDPEKGEETYNDVREAADIETASFKRYVIGNTICDTSDVLMKKYEE